MIWFEAEFKNGNFCPRAHLPLYIGVEVGTLAGYANPIVLPALCFTLEMATFELVTQHISFLTSPPYVDIFPETYSKTSGIAIPTASRECLGKHGMTNHLLKVINPSRPVYFRKLY